MAAIDRGSTPCRLHRVAVTARGASQLFGGLPCASQAHRAARRCNWWGDDNQPQYARSLRFTGGQGDGGHFSSAVPTIDRLADRRRSEWAVPRRPSLRGLPMALNGSGDDVVQLALLALALAALA